MTEHFFVVKFNGGQSITYVQGNQTKATLLKVPTIKKEENLCENLIRKGSIIDAMITAMYCYGISNDR